MVGSVFSEIICLRISSGKFLSIFLKKKAYLFLLIAVLINVISSVSPDLKTYGLVAELILCQLHIWDGSLITSSNTLNERNITANKLSLANPPLHTK